MLKYYIFWPYFFNKLYLVATDCVEDQVDKTLWWIWGVLPSSGFEIAIVLAMVKSSVGNGCSIVLGLMGLVLSWEGTSEDFKPQLELVPVWKEEEAGTVVAWW